MADAETLRLASTECGDLRASRVMDSLQHHYSRVLDALELAPSSAWYFGKVRPRVQAMAHAAFRAVPGLRD
jgi:hypothetical protein